MRTVLAIILLSTIALPCLAELSNQDIEQVRQIIHGELEPIKLDVAEIKSKMATEEWLEERLGITERAEAERGMSTGIWIAIIIGGIICGALIILGVIFSVLIVKAAPWRHSGPSKTWFKIP